MDITFICCIKQDLTLLNLFIHLFVIEKEKVSHKHLLRYNASVFLFLIKLAVVTCDFSHFTICGLSFQLVTNCHRFIFRFVTAHHHLML